MNATTRTPEEEALAEIEGKIAEAETPEARNALQHAAQLVRQLIRGLKHRRGVMAHLRQHAGHTASEAKAAGYRLAASIFARCTGEPETVVVLDPVPESEPLPPMGELFQFKWEEVTA